MLKTSIRICPIGAFESSIEEAAKLGKCRSCNFGANSSQIACMCPQGMSAEDYREQLRAYLAFARNKKRTRQDFWQFVDVNYRDG
jgi:Fe-S-cluster-containing hydrogenase component 2